MGNDAERAAVIAALSDLQVGDGLAGGAVAGQVLVADKGGIRTDLVHPLASFDALEDADDVLVVARSNNRLGLRQALQQFLLEVLGQAAGNDQLLALLGQLHQGAHGLFPGVLDEAAGVDHDDSRVGFIGADPIARLREQPEHVLGIDSVFFAAEMRERHGFASALAGAIGHG